MNVQRVGSLAVSTNRSLISCFSSRLYFSILFSLPLVLIFFLKLKSNPRETTCPEKRFIRSKSKNSIRFWFNKFYCWCLFLALLLSIYHSFFTRSLCFCLSLFPQICLFRFSPLLSLPLSVTLSLYLLDLFLFLHDGDDWQTPWLFYLVYQQRNQMER